MTHPDFLEEAALWNQGFIYIIGVDEVGRGAFAGPVVTAAVVFPQFIHLPVSLLNFINDSKKLSPKIRSALYPLIKQYALTYAISVESVTVINRHGIGKATTIAFRKTINIIQKNIIEKHVDKTFLLVDGFPLSYIRHVGKKRQKGIIKGDQKCISIAAASILAKVYRDSLMVDLDKQYPQYGFAKHKGYGTKQHQKTLNQYGLSPIHRTSFNLSLYIQ